MSRSVLVTGSRIKRQTAEQFTPLIAIWLHMTGLRIGQKIERSVSGVKGGGEKAEGNERLSADLRNETILVTKQLHVAAFSDKERLHGSGSSAWILLSMAWYLIRASKAREQFSSKEGPTVASGNLESSIASEVT